MAAGVVLRRSSQLGTAVRTSCQERHVDTLRSQVEALTKLLIVSLLWVSLFARDFRKDRQSMDATPQLQRVRYLHIFMHRVTSETVSSLCRKMWVRISEFPQRETPNNWP